MGNEKTDVVLIGAKIDVTQYEREEVEPWATRCKCDVDVPVGEFCPKCGTQHRTGETVTKSIILPPRLHAFIEERGIGEFGGEYSDWWQVAYEMQKMLDGRVLAYDDGVFFGMELYEFDCNDGDHGQFIDMDDLRTKARDMKDQAECFELALLGDVSLWSAHWWH